MYKKVFNYFVIVAVALFTACAMTACSDDDDDDDKGGSGNIVGDWRPVHSKGWEKENGKIVDQWDDEIPANDYLVSFKSDGSYTIFEGGSTYEVGTYVVKGDKITIKYNEDGYTDQESAKFKIKGDKLTFYFSEKEGDDGVTYESYEENTYKRVKK